VSLTEARPAPLCSPEDRAWIDAYWRAANFLAVGQIYLDNQHVKPRLLGHWGTTPGSRTRPLTETGSRKDLRGWETGRRLTRLRSSGRRSVTPGNIEEFVVNRESSICSTL
jgi:XFP N-terminal domain